MRHIFATAAFAVIALAAAAIPAYANEALAKGVELSTTQPRESTLGGADRLAYDVDFTGAQVGRAIARG